MKVQCIKGDKFAGLNEGDIYEVALELPAGTAYKRNGVSCTLREVGYVFNNDGYPYIWDSSRFVIV